MINKVLLLLILNSHSEIQAVKIKISECKTRIEVFTGIKNFTEQLNSFRGIKVNWYSRPLTPQHLDSKVTFTLVCLRLRFITVLMYACQGHIHEAEVV